MALPLSGLCLQVQEQGSPFGAGLGPDNQSMALGKAAGTFP